MEDPSRRYSHEEIAAGLQLLTSGVPLQQVLAVMQVSDDIYSKWLSDHVAVLHALMEETHSPYRLGVCLSDKLTQPVETVQQTLRHCKLRHEVCNHPATTIRELLTSGKRVGRFYRPEAKAAVRVDPATMVLASVEDHKLADGPQPFSGICSVKINELSSKG